MHRWLPAAAARARTIVVLTGHSLWKAVVGIANSDDLTHAASIAYYALLSLFPFLLLVLSVVGSITTDETSRVKNAGLRAPVLPRANSSSSPRR